MPSSQLSLFLASSLRNPSFSRSSASAAGRFMVVSVSSYRMASSRLDSVVLQTNVGLPLALVAIVENGLGGIRITL